MERIFERTRLAVAQGFEQALGVKLPDVDLIARLALAYLWEAAVREQIDPKGVDHARFFAHLRATDRARRRAPAPAHGRAARVPAPRARLGRRPRASR